MKIPEISSVVFLLLFSLQEIEVPKCGHKTNQNSDNGYEKAGSVSDILLKHGMEILIAKL